MEEKGRTLTVKLGTEGVENNPDALAIYKQQLQKMNAILQTNTS
jgi:hypothetical protein